MNFYALSTYKLKERKTLLKKCLFTRGKCCVGKYIKVMVSEVSILAGSSPEADWWQWGPYQWSKGYKLSVGWQQTLSISISNNGNIFFQSGCLLKFQCFFKDLLPLYIFKAEHFFLWGGGSLGQAGLAVWLPNITFVLGCPGEWHKITKNDQLVQWTTDV